MLMGRTVLDGSVLICNSDFNFIISGIYHIKKIPEFPVKTAITSCCFQTLIPPNHRPSFNRQSPTAVFAPTCVFTASVHSGAQNNTNTFFFTHTFLRLTFDMSSEGHMPFLRVLKSFSLPGLICISATT